MEKTVDTETNAPEAESKIKSFAKKYWKPVAAGAAITAAAVVAIARVRNSEDEDEIVTLFGDEIQAGIQSTDSPEQ